MEIWDLQRVINPELVLILADEGKFSIDNSLTYIENAPVAGSGIIKLDILNKIELSTEQVKVLFSTKPTCYNDLCDEKANTEIKGVLTEEICNKFMKVSLINYTKCKLNNISIASIIVGTIIFIFGMIIRTVFIIK